ncbi:phosphatidylglycerophosphatase A, partial [Helicobacter ailurogastricus]
MDFFSRACFLTLFYSGKFPKGPGTAGSVVALFLGLPILYLSANTLFLCAILIGLIAIKQIDIYEAQTHIHDDKQIVIDELVGMWMAMAIA